MKRSRSEPTKAGQESKAARRECSQPWERRACMILEVKLRNFMCHKVRSFNF